ncbi:MAG: class I SAM-dependent methyltransferase [Chloroflexota bacterium]
MSKPRLDYNQIANQYNQRYTLREADPKETALKDVLLGLGAAQVLEVGCGTGHWLELLAPQAGGVFGLDASPGMLRQARQRAAPLALMQGRAERLPLKNGALGLVFCLNALHHFDDPQAYITEVYRVLAPGGALAVIGSDLYARRDQWYIYQYFPGTHETDLKRFPPWEQVMDWMQQAGFQGIDCRLVETISKSWVGHEVLQDPFLQKHMVSQLALLSDEAYQAGLQRLQDDLEQAEQRGERLIFISHLTVRMAIAYRPPEEDAS